MTTSERLSSPSDFGAALLWVALLLGFVGLSPAAGRAAIRQEEEACRPEVFRLCASAIPSEDAIVACLDANLPRLAPACRAVMDPPPRPASTPGRRRTATP